MKNFKVKRIIPVIALALSFPAFSADFSVNQLAYEGAFRIPISTFGDSRIAYANGTIAVRSDDTSFFIVGHSQHQAIAEFEIPELSTAADLKSLQMAPAPLQKFVTVLDKVPSGNPDNLDRITGIETVGSSLVVNGVEFYDADTNAFDTTFIIDDSRNIANSSLHGFVGLDSGYHSAGWMSQVPMNLVNELGSEYIFGSASNFAINARSSVGPTAFAVEMNEIFSSRSGAEIQTEALIDFSVSHPLHKDRYNESLSNDIWTEVSRAHYGFIVPGTRTYAVFGTSAGHEFGIGYKITQDTGRTCGGPCPYVAGDRYNYYWLWDVDDLIRVREGALAPYEVRPYDYGKINLEFETESDAGGPKMMIGADYNPSSDRLYIVLGRADKYQSSYESAPIVLVYSTGRMFPSSPTEIKVE